jgi:hypothetical protein
MSFEGLVSEERNVPILKGACIICSSAGQQIEKIEDVI